MTPSRSGATIGILGGGQLGRMLSLAASRLGFRTHIYCPDKDSPAFEVTPHKTVAAYDDRGALDNIRRRSSTSSPTSSRTSPPAPPNSSRR